MANFRTSISAELGLSTTAAGADETEVDRRVNEGVVDVLLRTGCYVASATMAETSGAGDYTLPTACLWVKAFQWSNTGGSYSMPARVSPEEILRLRAWAGTTGSALPASAYAVAGSTLLMVYPVPSAADTITVYYVPRPTAMSSGTHDPSNATYGGIPSEFHPAVEMYALWRLASMTDDQSSGQGERYRIEYEGQDGKGGMIARIRGQVYRKGGRPGRAQLGPSRRRHPAHNDTYTSPWA